jgi:hypothetical protein
MPRVPIDYSKTVIYKIQHVEDENLLYVGSTTDFKARKWRHKSACKNKNCNKYNYKVYQMIRENGGWEMFNMIELEKYPCIDNNECKKKEDQIMREMKASMNSVRPYTTLEEKKENKKEYYNDNKDRIKRNNKTRYEKNKEQINEKIHEYYTNNKETIDEYRKQYRTNNKYILNEKASEKITCVCGCFVSKRNIATHRKTKKHTQLMEQLQ